MPESSLIFDSSSLKVRILLFAVIAAALILGFFGVRWQLGDMLAELTSPTDPQISQISDLAGSLAPRDPRARWLAATAATTVFSPEAIDSSVGLFGDTVRLSPYDFRWWTEYGRSLERAGRPAEAEAALLKAAQIAPNYGHPRWQLGNFYLRQGRTEDAFREFKLATTNSPTYRNQVFGLVWDYSGHDPRLVEQIAADSDDVRADLAFFFALRAQPAESLRVFDQIPDAEKGKYSSIAKATAQVFAQIGAFREGIEFSRQAGVDPDARFGAITDPGFEAPFHSRGETYFGWIFDLADGKAEIDADRSVGHSGKRSLRITFRNYLKQRFYNVWQNVGVEEQAHYKLNFWIRTENLRSGGPPVMEIAAAPGEKILATSESFPTGTNEWRQMSVEFTTPEGVSGVFVRTSRGYCGDTCPIAGIVWLDDLELIRS